MTETKKPSKVYRAGAVSISVWDNVSKEGNPYNSFSIQRSFTKDEGKTWENTNSFSRDDLAKLRLLCDQAYADAYVKE